MAYDRKAAMREAKRRRRHAAALRKRGWTMVEIGEKFEVSRQRVFTMLMRAEQEAASARKR